MFTLIVCAFAAVAQEADTSIPGQKPRDPDPPFGVREMQKKMQIDAEKKEYNELVERAEQAMKISQDLEKAYEQRASLTRSDLEKLDDLEKLVKKVRSGLGGDDDDDNNDDPQARDSGPKTVADGFKALPSLTVKMVDELKKSTRFGISAVAIQSSNAVLKVVRFLKLSK